MEFNRIPTDADYDFWLEYGYNVLFTGTHGIGKTESTQDKFNSKFGVGKWKYISASTMDPWVDFIGVPKERLDPETGEYYLDLVRPKWLDDVEAIMIDEYNRAPPKVRNAIMELIQFRSINGKKFPKLRVIWAARNPEDDDTYDVERIDPAQKDRFHIFVNLPYDVNDAYFKRRFSDQGPIACKWWRNLDEELRKEITPRRLSYALDIFNNKGDISYVLPVEADIQQLIVQLSNGAYLDRMQDLFLNGDDEEIVEAFANENFMHGTIQTILSDGKYIKRFVKHFPKDKLVMNFIKNEDVLKYFTVNEDYRDYQACFDPILSQSKQVDSSGKKTKTIWRDKEVNYSIISALDRWKKRTSPDSAMSTVEYVSTVSNFTMNISYLTDENKRRDVINRFGEILAEDYRYESSVYISMFGLMCELIPRVKLDDAELLPFVIKVITLIGEKMNKYGMGTLESHFKGDMPGFRRGKTNTIFIEVQDILVENDVLKVKKAA